MLTRTEVRAAIEDHLEGHRSLEDLSAWAVEREHEGGFDPADHDLIAEVLSVLRDASDPHRFRWEEPDLDGLLTRIDE
jgi:hypothetical protein